MTLFILRFWPVLLPLLLYYLWLRRARRIAKQQDAPLPRFRDGPVYALILATLGVGALCFLLLGAGRHEGKGQYVPAHMENGRLIEGHIER